MSLADQWRGKVAEFRDLAAELDQAESDLYAAYDTAVSVNAEMEWHAQFDQVNAYKSVIAAFLNMVDGAGGVWDDVSGWVSTVTGLSGLKKLGALQIGVPLTIAGISGLIAAGAAAVIAVYSAISAWQERRVTLLRESGVSPESAEREVYGEAGKPVTTALTDSVMWIALAVSAVLIILRFIK